MAPPCPHSHEESSRASLPLTFPHVNAIYTVTSEDIDRNLCTAGDSLRSRREAVDQNTLRRKFARYGHQHAHVSDLLSTDHVTKTLLQSSVLLQDDGALAAKLDDVTYLLDGLVGYPKTRRGRWTQTLSVLELIQLLQVPNILEAVELSCQRRQIQSKMKELLLTKLRQSIEAGDTTFRVTMAVLLYVLSQASDVNEWFDHKVLDAVVCALKQEVARDGVKECQKQADNVVQQQENVSDASTDQVCVRQKMCLKRKQSLCQQTSELRTCFGVFPCADGVSRVRSTPMTLQMLEKLCWMKLDELLRQYKLFYVEGKLHVCVVSVLSAALHILLQVGGHSSSLTSNRAQQYHREVITESGDATENTFELIQARKYRLVRNGAIDVLVHGFSQRLNGLVAILPSISVEACTLECAHLLKTVGMLLSVFDQATFLNLDVQQYISKKEDLFALLLKLIQLLSELSWGIYAHKRWEVEFTRMSLAVEILLAALRVLTNLTHHNLEAARHVLTLGGMQLLPASFFALRGLVAMARDSPIVLLATNEWEFDACLLLLSVMINSIELSQENRNALASAAFCRAEVACDLFTNFFLAKLESYKHLIDMTETQGASEAIVIDRNSDDWNPEDVILGGCASLLLGYMMEGSPDNCTTILNSMPDNSPRTLLQALSVFAAFHSQIDALNSEVVQSIVHIEKVLKSYKGKECDTYQQDLMRDAAAKTYSGVFVWQDNILMPLNSSPVAKSDEGENNARSMPSEKSIQCNSSGMFPPSVQVCTLRNVCTNLDEFDEDYEQRKQVRDNVVVAKTARANCQNLQAIEIEVPVHIPPRTSCTKQTRAKLCAKAFLTSQTRTRMSPYASRSSPTAVSPDGLFSSPVVARLVKQTCESDEEFDVEFALSSRSTREKIAENNHRGRHHTSRPCAVNSSFVVVTCSGDNNDGLNLSQDVFAETSDVVTTNKVAFQPKVRVRTSPKQQTKTLRNSDGIDRSFVGSCGYTFAGAIPSTPLRTHKSKALLQTPPKDKCSPGFYRSSPSIILRPTKMTPSVPLRSKKSAKLLRTSMKSHYSFMSNRSQLSVSPHRRKAKVARAPASAQCSSVFDFTA